MLSRLKEIGAWLKINGEAIYGTHPWVEAEGITASQEKIRFTRKDSSVYAMIFDISTPDIAIENLYAGEMQNISLLGSNLPISFTQDGARLHVRLPEQCVQEKTAVLKFTTEPYRLLKQKKAFVSPEKSGELFRRLGFLKVPL